MSKGCGIEFPHFGARYPDARCCDGYLWDMDSWDESLGGFTIGGEEPCPVCNTEEWLESVVDANMSADVIHPVFTTMMPKSLGIEKLSKILERFCHIKNEEYDGEAGLQLSINSTDEKQRNELFRSRSLSLECISYICRSLPMPIGRKYTLNFPVTDKTILDPKELSRLFDKDKFIVKITPIHETNEANANGINTPQGYYKYDVYRQFEQPLIEEGWEVIVFIPSKEEDEDRITCGNALLSVEQNK